MRGGSAVGLATAPDHGPALRQVVLVVGGALDAAPRGHRALGHELFEADALVQRAHDAGIEAGAGAVVRAIERRSQVGEAIGLVLGVACPAQLAEHHERQLDGPDLPGARVADCAPTDLGGRTREIGHDAADAPLGHTE